MQLKPRIQGIVLKPLPNINQLFQSISAKQPESHYHVLINPDSVIKPLTALGRHLHWQGLLTCRWTRHYLTEQWILEALSPRPPYWLTSMPRQDFNWLQPLTSPSLTYQDLPSTLNGTILTWYPQLQVHSIHSLPQQICRLRSFYVFSLRTTSHRSTLQSQPTKSYYDASLLATPCYNGQC